MDSPSVSARQHYHEAADAFVALVRSLPADSWERPGLGVWNVRDLVGHTSRALLTVESYLDPTQTAVDPEVTDSLGYIAAAALGLADPAAVAERGRQAGAALGDDPTAAVEGIADRVLALIDGSNDDALVTTPAGTMTLTGYLPTRTFELAVHSLDLAAATGVERPVGLAGPATACLHLAVELTNDSGTAGDVLLALTGRRPLPDGFSLL